MKRLLNIFIMFILMSVFSFNALAATQVFSFIGLTGAGTEPGFPALDGVAVATISDGAYAIGYDGNQEYQFHYDAASIIADSSPWVIVPNDNISGTGAWERLLPGELNYVVFDPQTSGPAHQEGLVYYDAGTDSLTSYNSESEIALQIGQEGWIPVYNDTGFDIVDGKICYLSGVVAGGFTTALAIANDPIKCLGTIGWATHTIENGTWGWITRWGLLNNQDTLGETPVTKLYLSATSEGDYVTTPTTSPNYLIGVGTMGIISETVGTIDVAISIGPNTGGVIKIFNGSVLEDTSTTVVSNGVDTVTLSYEQNGGGDLSLFFNGGFEVLDTTPAVTIDLTIGSDISPTVNYVYIPESTMVLTVSTTSFPSAQHVPVATVIVQSAASVLTDGLYKLHAWTDHLADSNDQGHLAHVNHWIREQYATWISGVDPTTTITVNGGAIDNVDFAITEGEVLQLHDHSMPAIDTATTGHIYAINDDTTAYRKVTDLSDLDEDSTGVSLRSNNTYYSLVIWGVVSEDAGDSQLYCNLPAGFYITETGALNDSNKYSNYTIPSEYKGTGFLIARLTLRYQTAATGTITEIETENLRGLFPSTSAGGGSPTAGNEFSDNLFRIQNVADITKQIAFDNSGITTGNTRTITSPNENVSLIPNATYQAYNAYLLDISSLTPVANNLLGWNAGGTAIENKSTISISWARYSSYEGTTVDANDYRWDAEDPTASRTFPIVATATKDIGWTITDTGVATAVADGLQGYAIPQSWAGMNITYAVATLSAAGTTGATAIQLRRVRAGTPVDIFSTELNIDSGDTTSVGAGTPYVVNAANDDLAEGDILYPDINGISITPGEGLSFTIEAEWPED